MGGHHRPPRVTRLRKLKGHAPVNFAIGPPSNAPLAAEMEIRVLRVAYRPSAVIQLKCDDCLVPLRLGHEPSFLHAHGVRQHCSLQIGSYPLYGNGRCAMQYAVL
jgi:hypothetical protein